MQMSNGRFLPAASSEEEQHSHRPSAHRRGGGGGGFDGTVGEEAAGSDEEGGSGDNGESEERRATTSATVAAAVEFARGYLGFAWLDVETRELLVAHAPDDADGPSAFSTLCKALRLSRAAVVHASERADSRLLAFLEERSGGGGRGLGAAAPPPPFSLVLERPGLFAQDAALAALSRVRVSSDDDDDEGDGGDEGEEERGEPRAAPRRRRDGSGDLFDLSSSSSSSSPPLAGRLSLDAPAQVAAAGALVSLAMLSAFSSSPPGSNLLVLRRVAESPLPGLLSVDAAALRELRVFAAEQHPGAGMLGVGGGGDGGGAGGGSSFLSSSSSKEGLSVFGLVGAKCATAAGRKVLRRWLASPLADVRRIEERLEAVEALVRLAGEGGGGGGGGRRGGFGGRRARNNGGEDESDVVAKVQRALRRGAASTPAALRRLAASHGMPDVKDFSVILDGIAAAVEAGEEVAEAFDDEDESGNEDETATTTTTTTAMTGTRRRSSSAAAVPLLLARLSDAAADPLLRHARALVSGALDVPSALAGGRLAAQGVLPALDALSAAFDSLPERLDRVVAAEAARIREVQQSQQHEQQRFGNNPSPSSSSWSCVYMPQIGFLMAFDGSSGSGDNSSFSSFSSMPPPPPSSLPGDYELAFSAGTGAVMPLPPQRPAATSVLFTVGGGEEESGGGGGRRTRRRKRRSGGGEGTAEEIEDDDLHPSSTGAFYRCASTRALDARFGDILNRIRDAEAALAAELVKRLLLAPSGGGQGPSSSAATAGAAEPPAASSSPAAAMARAAAAAAEVDALCALALTARERGWSRPSVVEEPVLWLRGVRHPLLELVVADFIPVDVGVGNGGCGGGGSGGDPPPHSSPPCALVITGAAGSGKSATARAAALAALLAHAGSFVPARSAVVGVADRLFVVGPGCSSSSFSSSSSSSSFCSAAAALGPVQGGSLARSLALVASALRLSTRRSVVVLDELGAGTLSSDGAGLAAAAAASLGARGARALLPTHHGELAQSSLMARLGDFFGGFAGAGAGAGAGGDSSPSSSSSSLAERVGVASMKVLVREIEEEEEGEEAAEEGGEEEDQEEAAAESKGQQNKKEKSRRSKKNLIITPLFRLEPAPDGPAPAYGLAAAAAAGMPAAVVRRAEEVAAAVKAAAAAAAAGNNSAALDDFSSSSATDPRLSAASARAARRAAALLARVATLPVASSVQGGRLCEEARALLEEALLLEEGQGGEG